MSETPAHVERTRQLTEDARERRWPNQRPRDAATLIIIDRSGKKPKVLMGRRHPNHKFMPGKFVFPGGRIEAGDRQMPVTGALDQHTERRLMEKVQRPSLQRCRALGLAAIRETFEETGLVFGTREFGAPPAPPPGTWSQFAAHGVYPDLSALTFIARAITPPGRPKRFDARFFTIDHQHVAAKVDGVVGPEAELDQLVWVTFDETRDIELPTITRVVLDELKDRITSGFSPFRPVPFYCELRRKWSRVDL